VIAEYFQNSESMGGPTRDWVGIYEECSTILYQEIDYLNEASNADRFRRDFRNQKWVRVPVRFSSKSGSKFLYVFNLSCIQKWVQVPVHFSFCSCIQNWV
jgi:predicted unusual protein kinase regulating ubiquinone biosynthesis (AarF/ABC1/UbiB family)